MPVFGIGGEEGTVTQLVDAPWDTVTEVMREHHRPGGKLEAVVSPGNLKTMMDILQGLLPREGHQAISDTDPLGQRPELPSGQGPLKLRLPDKKQAHQLFFLGIPVGQKPKPFQDLAAQPVSFIHQDRHLFPFFSQSE